MTNSTGPTSALCRWTCSTQYDDLPAEIRKETVTLIYDQVGGMIPSAVLPSCQPLISLLSKIGPAGSCSIVGHPLRTSVTNAALANGTIAHGDEVDATGQQGTGHYAAVTVAAGLTVGQYVSASGRDLCRAVTIGSEVAARFQSILSHHGTRNQFVASVGATMGAAVTSGLLLNLDADRMEHALGLAAACACGLASAHLEELHQTKSLNRGKAVEGGVLAALLAQEGYHGPREIMTVENGFFDAYLGLPKAGYEVVEGLGENYLMRQIAYKRFPVGGPNQTPLYAFLQLIRTHKLVADDIEQIEVSVSRGAFQTVMTNKHPSVHMPIILSLAAVYGDLNFTHIHEPRYRDTPEFRAFQERVRIFIIPRPGPSVAAERLQMGIIVRKRNGEKLSQNIRYPLMSSAEIEQKFRYLVGLRLAPDAVAALEQKLLAIESEKNVASLVSELEIPYSAPK